MITRSPGARSAPPLWVAALCALPVIPLLGTVAADALTRAASILSEHPLLEALGADDASTPAELARVDVRSAGWGLVAGAAENLLNRSGRRGTPTVLRWLSSFLLAPADSGDITADVEVLVAGLPPRNVDTISDVLRASRRA